MSFLDQKTGISKIFRFILASGLIISAPVGYISLFYFTFVIFLYGSVSEISFVEKTLPYLWMIWIFLSLPISHYLRNWLLPVRPELALSHVILVGSVISVFPIITMLLIWVAYY